MKITNPAWKSRLRGPGGAANAASFASVASTPFAAASVESVAELPEGRATEPGLEPATTYDILFVGLVCFLTKEKGDRLVLLPDGTNPGPETTPHFPYMVVDPSSIVEANGWEGLSEQLQALANDGMLRLPKCTISIDGVNNGKGLNTKQHDQDVPKLADVDNTVQIDADNADAIVRLNVASGVLEAYRRPETEEDDDDANDPSDVAIISRLRVEHEGEITVKVTPSDGPERILRLKPGTDIALANVAFPDTGEGREHFSIYGKLLTAGTINPARRQRISQSIPRLSADHHIFSFPVPITDGGSQCGNQGCCRTSGGG